jgi:PTS system nitrogen regulatory IIA component
VLLSQLLTPQRIRIPLAAVDKPAALRELVAMVAENDRVAATELLLAVEEREAVLSTGIGHGVAIPHGRSGKVREILVSAGVSAAPIEYGSLDGAPVQLFFLLIGPENEAGIHVRALSRISRLVRQPIVRELLLKAATNEEFHRRLCEAEGP